MTIRAVLVGGVAVAAFLAAGVGVTHASSIYGLDTLIAIPADAANHQVGGAFNAFDISFFDPTTRLDYVADRSNAAVDVFGGRAFIGRTPGFTGQQATTSVSGPDGVLTVSNGAQHTLFAGDGDSTLKSFNITSSVLPAPIQFPALNTGGSFRVDEMAYSPLANLVLAANNADGPAFGTLVNASTGAAVFSHITVPGDPTGGLEQPVWNPTTKSFFISVPQFGSSGPGGIAEIKTDGTIGQIIDFGTMGIASCAPTGLAMGKGGNMVVACGNKNTQTLLVDPSTGKIVNSFARISGSDEIWCDQALGECFLTGTDTLIGRAIDVTDLSLNLLQAIALPNVNAHSVSVDPGNGDIYVPLPGGTTDALCPLGCVAVFAKIPEPGTMPLLATAIAGLAILDLRRRRNRNRSD